MEEKTLFSRPWRIFFFEILLFSLTLILGISAAFKINKYFAEKEITVAPIPPSNFLLTFFVATLSLFLLIKFLKFERGKSIFLKIFLSLSFFLGGIFLFNTWLDLIYSFVLITILILWWLKSPSVLNQNLLMIFGMAGIGATLGLKLEPQVLVGILIVLSIYDWIAVYKTKHMVKMARAMIEMGVISAIVIPQSISGFKNSLEKVKPGGEFLVLGGGDVVLPLIFAVSLIPFGVLKSAIVALFSLIGATANFFVFVRQKERKPMPALPLISLFSIIGYLITFLI
jgi:presenilin-like A22 family membrane protease